MNALSRRSIRPGSRAKRSSGETFLGFYDFSPQRVRQPVAKSRHIGRFAFEARFIFSHASAQERMRSREARGNDGGGEEVSTGGSGASLVCVGGVGSTGAALGAGCCAGAFAGTFCFVAVGAGAAGFTPVLELGFCSASSFCGFVFGAAGVRAAGL